METLRNMPFEAVVGVVEDFPWFGAAQRTLCEKMALMSGRDIARDVYLTAALHVPERRKITAILHSPQSAPAGKITPAEESGNSILAEVGLNENYRGAGDYFSREQYEQVKKDAKGTGEVVNTAGTTSNSDYFNFDRDVSLDGFCTEALAEIYAEQGYFERAKDIYAKLILAEPEKNTYFASLIEKLNEKN